MSYDLLQNTKIACNKPQTILNIQIKSNMRQPTESDVILYLVIIIYIYDIVCV